MIAPLFESGRGKSFPVYPLRAVFMPVEGQGADGEAAVSILVSVSKRHFKHAVDRNRVKRQLREAYRKHKHLLDDALAEHRCRLSLAFIWLSGEHHPTAEIEQKMQTLLCRVAEKITATPS